MVSAVSLELLLKGDIGQYKSYIRLYGRPPLLWLFKADRSIDDVWYRVYGLYIVCSIGPLLGNA